MNTQRVIDVSVRNNELFFLFSLCPLVMVHNPAYDLFSIGHFLCRVRVVDCCDLRNGGERQ